MNNRVAVPPSAFPPSVIVAVKALACELPHRLGKPLSRFSLSELKREVVGAGLVASISGTTVWRWLSSNSLATGFYNRVSHFTCVSEQSAIRAAFSAFKSLEKEHGPAFLEHLSGRPFANALMAQ